jgi:CheY-like chemotaxis protein
MRLDRPPSTRGLPSALDPLGAPDRRRGCRTASAATLSALATDKVVVAFRQTEDAECARASATSQMMTNAADICGELRAMADVQGRAERQSGSHRRGGWRPLGSTIGGAAVIQAAGRRHCCRPCVPDFAARIGRRVQRGGPVCRLRRGSDPLAPHVIAMDAAVPGIDGIAATSRLLAVALPVPWSCS